MFKGTVKHWNVDRGFGFIARDDGESDTFVHISGVLGSHARGLQVGDRVAFDLAAGKDGRSKAVEVRLLDEDTGLPARVLGTMLAGNQGEEAA